MEVSVSVSFQLLLLCSIHSLAILATTALDRSAFPADFMFGAASSAYQYEGAWSEDGKGPSTWDAFTHTPGRVDDGRNGDVADDQYHRYLEDIELMASLGLDAYRFSISWSRILPDGRGKINAAGIEYYNNLINTLLKKGIQPFITLFHFDLPEALEDSYRGWLSPQIVKDFEAFADICFQAFGDRVRYWATINEPNIFVPLGYIVGRYPPARCSPSYEKCPNASSLSEPYVAAHHALLAHAAAVDTYRSKYQKTQGGSIGFVISAQWYKPLEDTPDDRSAAGRILAFNMRWFLDPIVLGDYPHEMRELLRSRLPLISSQVSAKLRGSFDFLDSMVYLTGEKHGIPIGEQTGIERTYVVPRGIQKIVEYLRETYNNPLMIITENGYPESKNSLATLREALNDVKRIRFHSEYLDYLAKAIRNGSDVRGYFFWSLLDNFEWAYGYTIKFGLYYVDPLSQERCPKLSAQWLRQSLSGDNSDAVGFNTV